MTYTDEQRAYHRAYYHERRRAPMIEYLGGVCVVCGGTEDLPFDHIDPAQKSFSINAKMSLRNPEVRAELEKCQLLCRAHHEEKTARENSGFTHGTVYGWMKVKCGCGECEAAKRMWHEERNARRRQRPAQDRYRS